MDPETRRERVQLARLWFLASLSALVLAPVLPAFARFAPACPLHALTGVPCPTCGSTRAALSLFGGEPLAALAWNPLIALAAGGFLAGGLTAPLWLPRLRGRKPPPVWIRVGVPLVLGANWLYLFLAGV
jgi:hypothetical protein